MALAIHQALRTSERATQLIGRFQTTPRLTTGESMTNLQNSTLVFTRAANEMVIHNAKSIPLLTVVIFSLVSLLDGLAGRLCAQQPTASIGNFLQSHCLECHSDSTQEGSLDITTLKWEAGSDLQKLVRIYERVLEGEMPPKSETILPEESKAKFLSELSSSLNRIDIERIKLRNPVILREQVERMLDHPKSNRFVEAFTDYWLDLRKIDDTSARRDFWTRTSAQKEQVGWTHFIFPQSRYEPKGDCECNGKRVHPCAGDF